MSTQPIPVMQPTAEQVADLAGRSVVFSLEIRSPRFVRKVSTAEFAPEEDSDLFHVSKDLIDQDALSDIRRHASKFKGWMRNRRAVSCSLLRGGMYLIPAQLVVDVDERCQKFLAEREALVDAFLAKYDALKMEARQRLGAKHYKEQDYPAASLLQRAFAVNVGWLTIDVPRALERVNADLFAREQARVESDWREAWGEIRDAVRMSFAELVEHLSDRLAPEPDGKRKVLRDSVVENLKEFLSTFAARNLTNDEEMAALADKARKVIDGVSGEDLRNVDLTRDRVVKGLAEVRRKIDGLVINQPRRQMSRTAGRA
jgi:hypothetical protein